MTSLSGITPSGRADARQPPRCTAPVRRPGRVLLRREPARDDDQARSTPTPNAHPGDGDVDARRRAATGHRVRAVRRTGARPARLPAGVHLVRRGAVPDDPVQGEGERQTDDPGLAVHLSLPDGGGHPALRHRPGPGGWRPGPARRAGPGRGDPVQPGVRRDVRGAAVAEGGAGDADQGPGEPDHEDEQVGRGRRGRNDPVAGPAGRDPCGRSCAR